jgi:hypothetical protein
MIFAIVGCDDWRDGACCDGSDARHAGRRRNSTFADQVRRCVVIVFHRSQQQQQTNKQLNKQTTTNKQTNNSADFGARDISDESLQQLVVERTAAQLGGLARECYVSVADIAVEAVEEKLVDKLHAVQVCDVDYFSLFVVVVVV